jgi:hypothetical protein
MIGSLSFLGKAAVLAGVYHVAFALALASAAVPGIAGPLWLSSAFALCMGVAMAGLLCQRGNVEKTLKAERDKLELTVQERTLELIKDIEQRKGVEQQLLTREQQLADAQRLAQI